MHQQLFAMLVVFLHRALPQLLISQYVLTGRDSHSGGNWYERSLPWGFWGWSKINPTCAGIWGCHTSQLREETARWNFAGGMPIYTEGASVRSEIKQFCNSLRTSFLSIMVHISDDDPLMVGRQDYWPSMNFLWHCDTVVGHLSPHWSHYPVWLLSLPSGTQWKA